MVTAMTQYTAQLSYAAIAEVVNEEVMIMPMIETKEGVENVEYLPQLPRSFLEPQDVDLTKFKGHSSSSRNRRTVNWLRRFMHGVSSLWTLTSFLRESHLLTIRF
jgi:2-keto-3-deoxy-L-rhamnonate aldolase RhmA